MKKRPFANQSNMKKPSESGGVLSGSSSRNDDINYIQEQELTKTLLPAMTTPEMQYSNKTTTFVALDPKHKLARRALAYSPSDSSSPV